MRCALIHGFVATDAVGSDPPDRVRSAPAFDAGESPGRSSFRQVSLARISEFDVEPNRDLGQNFLVDDNILRVILAQLGCRPDDVVLEVGAGLGVLTSALAGVAAHVHAYEIDRRLEGPLTMTLQGHQNVDVHFEDVLRAPLETLDPVPTLCGSNLPYSVAGPFLIEALRRLSTVRRYCVMVQREVAQRLAAAPGSRVYGALSVWVQLYATVEQVRSLSRNIFFPRPNVDSSLVVLQRLPHERLPPVAPEELAQIIRAAFSQRRKTLANSLSAGLEINSADAARLISEVGLPEGVRAERLEPGDFVSLAQRAGGGA